MSSSFRSFVEHAFFSSSLMFQIRLFWACAREPAAERPAPLKERNPTGGRLHPGLLLPLVTAPRSAELPRGCRIPRTVLPARGRGVRLGRGRSGRAKAGGEAAAQAPWSPEPVPQGQVPGHAGTHPKHQVHLPQHPAPREEGAAPQQPESKQQGRSPNTSHLLNTQWHGGTDLSSSEDRTLNLGGNIHAAPALRGTLFTPSHALSRPPWPARQ